MSVFEHVHPFINLFGGLEDSKAIGAHGTGAGRWVKRPLNALDVAAHLAGDGVGIGVPPLRPDNTVVFAAIDLDEPDFDAARQMQELLPGPSWLERSRSGNAHVWVFFKEPIEAWIVQGILKEVTVAAGKMHVEVFPKNHDFAAVKLGNYINLPYHGNQRPILGEGYDRTLHEFVTLASDYSGKNDLEPWLTRARWMLMEKPERRVSDHDGPNATLHICAEYIIGRALSGEQPIIEGHRAAVYFALAKQLRQCAFIPDDEALETLRECNAASPDRVSDRELCRIFDNAANFRSTGCDDPLVQPFTHPDCPIARS